MDNSERSSTGRSSRLAGLIRDPRSTVAEGRRGFTLTELLVVISIIAILASLGTYAAVNGLKAAKRGRITMELNQLSQSVEDFKNKYGAYPPNGMNDGSRNSKNQYVNQIVASDFARMFKKAFPRHREDPELIAGLAGASGNAAPQALEGGMSAGEAVYFWLGGFSEDPEYPISGLGGPSFRIADAAGEVLENRTPLYPFELSRLGPRRDNGRFNDERGFGRYIVYDDPRTGDERRINLWQYLPAGSQQPYVYFDVSRHKPAEYSLPAAPMSDGQGRLIYPLVKLREGITAINAPAQDIVFVNGGKFQILHAGLDDAWGDMSVSTIQQYATAANLFLAFPTGPFTGDLADNLTNFTTGTLEDSQEE
ncbi:MAG: prepilin-type N-terminal cleavage/methylation domain-containing protein [Pirellulales bacterium]|nr:prepilin-type N-terminal cleavage/methylation domain-containing protein [Pirellulales bacterium]